MVIKTIIMYIKIYSIYIALSMNEGDNTLTGSTNPAYGVTGKGNNDI